MCSSGTTLNLLSPLLSEACKFVGNWFVDSCHGGGWEELVSLASDDDG